jgi:PIN domain nuclease of toxin-antitoxin system
VKILLDTHFLIWAAETPEKLSAEAAQLIAAPENDPFFSIASLWEMSIKRGLGWADFLVDAKATRRGLLDNGYRELPITSEHAFTVHSLPPIHRDPFDRMLVAQAMVEGITLLTADPKVARYPGPIRLV